MSCYSYNLALVEKEDYNNTNYDNTAANTCALVYIINCVTLGYLTADEIAEKKGIPLEEVEVG